MNTIALCTYGFYNENVKIKAFIHFSVMLAHYIVLKPKVKGIQSMKQLVLKIHILIYYNFGESFKTRNVR